MVLEFINLFLILAIFMGLMLWIRKIIKNKNSVLSKKSKYIRIIDDGLSMGIGHRLSIVKVNDEYFLLSHSQNGSTFQKLEGNDFERLEEKWSDELKGNQINTLDIKSYVYQKFSKKNGGK